MDELAKENHTYHLSTEEFKRYQGQWNLTEIALEPKWLRTQSVGFWKNHTYSRVITRHGPVNQILTDMGVAMKVTGLTHSNIDRVSPCTIKLNIFKHARKERMNLSGFLHVTVGDGLIPSIEPSFFWLREIKINHDASHSVGIRKLIMMGRNLSRERLRVSSGSKRTLTITNFFRPDCTFTIWSRPWQVITCVTTAPWGRRSCGCKGLILMHSRGQEWTYSVTWIAGPTPE